MTCSRVTLVLATRNPGKCREIREVLADAPVEIVSLDSFAPVAEPAEDGATFAENARHKALYYARATGQWCLADDSGLVVDALGGAPGVHSARYAADECPPESRRDVIDAANNAKLLRELAGVPDDKRTARFVCHLAMADAREVLIEARGAIEGCIGHVARGDNGFGYDPLFWVTDRGCTTAELPSDDKNRISHRGQALRTFAHQLERLLATRGDGARKT